MDKSQNSGYRQKKMEGLVDKWNPFSGSFSLIKKSGRELKKANDRNKKPK